jgi:putative ABC transport system substrate-binding protein
MLPRLPGLVDELIAFKPDVLVGNEQAARVMKNKTSTIPIVLTNSSDPVAVGLVQSLARPGGNVTGASYQYEQLGPKHMELLREMLPRLAKVGQLHDTNVPAHKAAEENARQAARKLRLAYVPYYVASRIDVERAFVQMEKDRPDALVPGAGSGLLFELRQMIIENALRLRIAYCTSAGPVAEAGALMSYGANIEEGYRLAATYVDRILKGVKPAELPVQQPTRFEMVINLKTAKALGVTIPQSVLLRADRMIE